MGNSTYRQNSSCRRAVEILRVADGFGDKFGCGGKPLGAVRSVDVSVQVCPVSVWIGSRNGLTS